VLPYPKRRRPLIRFAADRASGTWARKGGPPGGVGFFEKRLGRVVERGLQSGADRGRGHPGGTSIGAYAGTKRGARRRGLGLGIALPPPRLWRVPSKPGALRACTPWSAAGPAFLPGRGDGGADSPDHSSAIFFAPRSRENFAGRFSIGRSGKAPGARWAPGSGRTWATKSRIYCFLQPGSPGKKNRGHGNGLTRDGGPTRARAFFTTPNSRQSGCHPVHSMFGRNILASLGRGRRMGAGTAQIRPRAYSAPL